MSQQQAINNTTVMPINDFDNNIVVMTTQIEHIGPMLYYMAECEFLASQSNQNYEAEIYNGRGFMLKMLGEGLTNFWAPIKLGNNFC